MKQHLEKHVMEKEHKELEHQWAKLMLNDRWAVHAHARVDFEKVKDDLDVGQLGMQKSFKTLFVQMTNVLI
jgi:hypothetical protein